MSVLKQFNGVSGRVSVSPVGNTVGPPLNIVVDHSGDAGDLGTGGLRNSINALPPTPVGTAVKPLGKVRNLRKFDVTSVFLDVAPQQFSQESGFAPYETLYHDCAFEVHAVYNFWEPDETTNDRMEKGGRSLSDIPRYVRVLWSAAPDLPDDVTPGSDKRFRPFEAVKLGLQTLDDHGVFAAGHHFSPSHLRRDGFDLIKNSLANGHVAPGVISSVVELAVIHTAASAASSVSRDRMVNINEDRFLLSPDTDGLSPHELVSNAHEATNGLLDTGWLVETPLSVPAASIKGKLFDGNFSIERPRNSVGSFKLSGLQASSPALSLLANVPLSISQRPAGPDHVMDILGSVSDPAPSDEQTENRRLRVKFVHPSLDGALDQRRINLMTEPHHAEAVVALAQNISNLDMLSRSGFVDRLQKLDAPSFPSPPGLKSLEYVGYVLEKYMLSKRGTFEKVEEIDLPSREYEEYVDTKVVYGGVYRYRIRSILRWTRPNDVGILGKDESVFSQFGSQTRAHAPFKSSYFGSEWSPNWAHASIIDQMPPPPPDELTVRSDSPRSRIVISAKFPENSQRDIFIIRLFRKLQDADGKDLSAWNQVGPDFGPQNVIHYDTDVGFFQRTGVSYVYTAQSISRHWEFSTYSEQIAGRLNSQHKVFGEFPLRFISSAGVRPEYFGAFSTSPPKRSQHELIVVPEEGGASSKTAAFDLSGRASLSQGARDARKYFLRAQSLDTGETVDFELSTSYLTMPADVRQSGVPDVVHVSPRFFAEKQAELAGTFSLQTGPTAPGGLPSLPTDRPL